MYKTSILFSKNSQQGAMVRWEPTANEREKIQCRERKSVHTQDSNVFPDFHIPCPYTFPAFMC